MFCFTGTWQLKRQPSFCSRRLKCGSSVGRIEPPPSFTTHLHCAQLPPPPHADARNTLLAASVCSNLPPAGTVIVFSSLIRICTSPLFTNLALATRITTTNAMTIAVNMTTPNTISIFIEFYSSSRLERNAAKRHKA